MAELEIHHETEGESDSFGKKVGVLAALLAVALAIVTIASHRTHTSAIMHKSTANDQWAYYQATRIKLHGVEMSEQLTSLVGANNLAAAALLSKTADQKAKYEKTSQDIQNEAQKADDAAEADEHRALRYDIGEGLLEIGLVLSSLYFISKKRMFPAMGILAGAAGVLIALTGVVS